MSTAHVHAKLQQSTEARMPGDTSGGAFDTPIDVFRAAVAAADRSDWLAAAGTCDPVSLASFRRQLLERFSRAEPEYVMTLEEYMRHMPDTPREVAEYHVAQHRAAVDPGRQFREELPTVADVARLGELSPVEVFAAWLEGRSPRHQIQQRLTEGRISAATAAKSLEHLPPMLDYEAIGAVRDGERMAHVVYRAFQYDPDEWARGAARWLAPMSADEQMLARDVAAHGDAMITLCRQQPDGTWRLLAGHAFLNIGSIAIYLADEPSEAEVDADAD